MCYSIVGIGNHSRDGVPKIKPAVEELCRQLNLPVVQQLNPGRVYISLPQPQQKHTSSRGSSHYVSPGHGTSSVVPRVPSRVVPVQLHTPVPVRNQDHAYFQDYYHRRPPPRRVDVPLDRTPGTFILSVVAWFFFLATIPVVCLLLCPWVFWRILNVLRILTLRCLHVCLKRLEDWKVDESLSSLPYWLERLRVVLLQYNYVCSKVLGNLKVDIPQEALLSRIFWGILEYLRVHLLQFHQMCSQGLKHWKVDASSASVVYWLERLRVVILQFLYIFWRGLNGWKGDALHKHLVIIIGERDVLQKPLPSRSLGVLAI